MRPDQLENPDNEDSHFKPPIYYGIKWDEVKTIQDIKDILRMMDIGFQQYIFSEIGRNDLIGDVINEH